MSVLVERTGFEPATYAIGVLAKHAQFIPKASVVDMQITFPRITFSSIELADYPQQILRPSTIE